MIEPRYENEFIKYVFTETELKEIAGEMAQKIVNLQQAEDDLKAIKSDYKSQIDGIQAGVNSAATKMTSGYEMRSTKCEMVPDYPRRVWKYIRLDTGECVKEKDMTSNDLQKEFDDENE